MRRFLSIISSSLLLLLLFSPFFNIVPIANAACTRSYPLIEVEADPLSGSDKDSYKITLKWSKMSASDFDKYIDTDVEIYLIDEGDPDKRPIAIGSSDYMDRSGTRPAGEDKTHTISDLTMTRKADSYPISVHLIPRGELPSSCRVELNPITLVVSGTFEGSTCSVVVGDPSFSCPLGQTCRITVNADGSTGYHCKATPTVELLLADAYCKEGVVGKDGKIETCKAIDTAIGAISTKPSDFVGDVFSKILGLAGGIALIIIIITGYRFITSRGNPEKIQEAREQLVSAIIGLLFIIFAFVILEVIGVDILHIPGFGKP